MNLTCEFCDFFRPDVDATKPCVLNPAHAETDKGGLCGQHPRFKALGGEPRPKKKSAPKKKS